VITVGMNYYVIPGKQHEFEEKFNAVLGALEAADGHTQSHLYRDVNDETSYLIVSEWSSEQAFGDVIRSDAFKAVTNWGKAEILRDRPKHKIYKN